MEQSNSYIPKVGGVFMTTSLGSSVTLITKSISFKNTLVNNIYRIKTMILPHLLHNQLKYFPLERYIPEPAGN